MTFPDKPYFSLEDPNILYDGKQRFNVQNVRIFNPLLGEDIWETLIAAGAGIILKMCGAV